MNYSWVVLYLLLLLLLWLNAYLSARTIWSVTPLYKLLVIHLLKEA